jgi:PAS domain S-box-containing protein
MKKHSEEKPQSDSLKEKIMGLGEKSMRKSYYPELQKRIRELEENNELLTRHIREKELSQQATVESEALLADIINFQPTGTYRLRLSSKSDLGKGIKNKFSFDFMSRKFCEIMHFDPDLLYQNPFNLVNILHPDDKNDFLEKNNQSIKNFTSFFWEGRILVDNREKWIQLESHPRLLADGDRVWTGIAIDITARRKADEALRISEETFRLIFDSSPVGIISYNEHGIITACNSHFADIMGTEKNNLLGSNTMKLPHKTIVDTLRRSLGGERSVFEGEFIPTKGKKAIQIRLQFAPIRDEKGKVKGGVGIMENFAERIRNEKLEQEITIARKSAEFKQNFLANMSHEIRTPLTGIEGMVNILAKTPLSEEQKDYIDTIITSSQNLREIINQILDYSKIEAGQMLIKPRPFKMNELVNKTKRLLASLCTDQIPFKIVVPDGLPENIESDDQKIFQIITNLISNAVKYAPNGIITVEFLQIPLRNTEKFRFMIKVTDEGPGISLAKQKDIFSPFSQLEQVDLRTIEGTGLGLSISKEMTRILGGTIGLESEPGKGSTFWFTFQAKFAEQIVDVSPDDTHQPSKDLHLNIMLVEDKKINQKVISLILESLGHKITLADNGLLAVQDYKPGVYDLILMDIQMPEMDGITATNKLREIHKNLPPIVGLSANAFEGDKEKYMKLGMDDYLTKPVTSNDFNQLLKRWFRINE